MYYILNENYALRSYRLVPYAYLKKGVKFAGGLKKEEFEILRKCDGKTELENSDVLTGLINRGLVFGCEKDQKKLSSWQEYRNCDNRYVPTLNLQITGKCNYNCLHCFNCSDNAPLQSEMSFEEIVKLFDECVECGVTSFTITGGEPFVHPHFRDILSEIYKRNLFVFELNTNGYFINEDVLDFMISIGCKPAIKISFDGLGYHDWMRKFKGAEKRALEAVALCVKKGFEVRVQTNVNKKNYESIYETLCLLEKMGVSEVRLIKTTDAPRWRQNANGLDFDWEEFYDFVIELFKKYAHEEHKMSIYVWQTLYYNPENHYYNLSGVFKEEEYSLNKFICPDARKMLAVASNGEVYNCMQVQGYMVENNISFGNAFKDGLKNTLGDSKIMKQICLTLKDKLEKNEECRDCKYLKYCQGTCPALAILTGGWEKDKFLAPDRTKCLLYKNGYYHKFVETLGEENTNNSKIDI